MPMSTDPGRPVVGIDIGGTKILGRVIDPVAPTRALAECRVDTPTGATAIVSALVDLVRQLEGEAPVALADGLAAVGVGVAGLVDLEGVLRFAPNLPGVMDFALGPELEARLHTSVTVDNDANCAAWCEFVLGASASARDAVLVTLGTGIGAGVVIDGVLQRGAHGFAGEPGHMLVDPGGPPCPCGRRGCWERFASGSALGRLGREAVADGRAPGLLQATGVVASDLTGADITRAAVGGHPDALEVLRRFAWWVAAGLANLVDLLDPEVLVVGGGVAEAGETLLVPVREAFAELVLGRSHRPGVGIVGPVFGPEAGAIGAALLARDRGAGPTS